MRTILSFFIGIALLGLAFIAGCGDDESDSAGADSSSGSVAVVASTTQLGDVAGEVVGDRGDVTQVLSANSDPHDYEPAPSDAEAFIDANLIVDSGGDLDIWVDELIESSGSSAPVLTVLDSVPTIEGEEHAEEEHAEEEGEVHSEEEGEEHAEGEEIADPHWWQDPTNVIIAVESMRDELSEIDPDGAETYADNADAYIAQLEDLDSQIAACMEQVPVEQRKLVTSHDALGYFAERYGVEVIGAAIPALTTQAQASAGETAELVDLIREEGVTTIFAEAGVSTELEQAIADEAGASVGGELWADTLGPEGSDGATYLEAMATNAANLTDGFSGGAESCEIDVS